MLEIILSSVVLVAIIQMIVQNKNNKLQYITNESNLVICQEENEKDFLGKG